MSYEQAKALLNKGVSRPTLYSLLLPNRFGTFGPNTGISTATNDHLQLFCNAVSVPEVSVATTNANAHEYMGITREQPVNMIYGKPLQINVIENSEFSNYRDIRNWLNLTTQNGNQGNNTNFTQRNQRMRFYNTYVGNIQLIKLEFPDTSARGSSQNDRFYTKEYKEVFRVHFINAYPINLGEIRLGSDLYDTKTEYKVDFTYESYHLDYSQSTGTVQGQESVPDLQTGTNSTQRTLQNIQTGIGLANQGLGAARQVGQLFKGL